MRLISDLPDSVLFIINRVIVNKEGRIILSLNHKRISEIDIGKRRGHVRYSLVIYLTGGVKLKKRSLSSGEGYTSITDYLGTMEDIESTINDFLNGKI
jgi:hypothetical protein